MNFDFSIVFYDATILYFESFEEDNWRRCGFSKDNKFNQPQIVIGLIVENNGFPVSYEIFEGNKFEGHTLLPSIVSFKNKYKIQNLTVIADAAMISIKNIESLLIHNLNYIAGARLGNLKSVIQKKINKKLKIEINQELIEKTKMMLGIKGYYTNFYKLKNKSIIKHYHNLWYVEKSFRMGKE